MFAWILVIILAVWLIVKYSKTSNPPHDYGDSASIEKDNITEEEVFEAQASFEKELLDTFLPDAVSGRDIYIYRNLVCKWFYELASKNRYNDEMTQKLRRDFLDYMYAVRHGKTANYLSLELEDKEKAERYDKEATISGRKAYSIENAFASSVGEGAIDELKRARELDYFAVDKDGNLAPNGYRFNFDGKLEPVKQVKVKS